MQLINDYKEIFIFLFFLGVWLCAILFFKLDLTLGLQNLITTSAIIVALGATIISTIFNKKALKQSEINLNKQLLHEDRKNAIFEILEIINAYQEKDEFLEREINQFLESPQAIYLPDDINERLYGLLDYHFNPEYVRKEIRKICKEILLNP